MKTVKDIIKVMEKIAPVKLKEDFDNVGLMVGNKEKEVSKILLALDCTLDVIKEAKDNGVDLIITHHPLIFQKPRNITMDTLQGRKIIELIKNDISLYSSHTNLDSVKGGLNQTIVELLGYKDIGVIEKNRFSEDQNDGLGRLVELKGETSIYEIIENVKEKLEIDNLRIVKGNEKVNKLAIINGSGQGFIAKAISMGADCIITGDTTYHFASDCKENGISIIDIGHFLSEWKVFLKVMDRVKESVTDIEFIESNKVNDPYDFI